MERKLRERRTALLSPSVLREWVNRKETSSIGRPTQNAPITWHKWLAVDKYEYLGINDTPLLAKYTTYTLQMHVPQIA